MAGALRHATPTLQQALPGEPPGVSDPGAGLRRAEARGGPTARAAWRAIRRWQHRRATGPRQRPADRRHSSPARVPGCGAHGDGAAGRLRVARSALQVPLRDRPGDHRHPLERAGLLRPQEPAERGMKKSVVRKLRCAIYTRKSTEEGLDMEFNSLDAQREACSAFIASQRAEGWLELADQYDDGGFSGGTLERPALKRLLADIEAGRVDVVVVHKIDRLS